MSRTADPNSARQQALLYQVDYGSVLRAIKRDRGLTPERAAAAIKNQKDSGSGSQYFGLGAELKVLALLARYGRKVQEMPYGHAYDLLIDGVSRVEIKAAFPQMAKYGPFWKFNIHRHGRLSESCDFYILRLEKVPFTKAAIHLLLKAPLNTPTIEVSFRSLLNGRSSQVADFYAFAKGYFPKTEAA